MSRFRSALRPFFAPNPWDNFRGPLQLFDQPFGMGLNWNDFLRPIIPFPTNNYNRPSPETSCVEMGKDGFKMMMDVQHFRPDEITVKQVENSIVVEGKHEETADEHGFVSRHFVRRYELPTGVDAKALTSTLSSDGVLTVTAPKIDYSSNENVRTINIEQTGKPAIEDAEKNPKNK
ncbi:heat shock protein 23-like [Hetaerina americana]|uniref:heat shock protein 23-like n=1 Tax=Hetaerina americana TaxID=62018 RepID=UPI003A7F14A0